MKKKSFVTLIPGEADQEQDAAERGGADPGEHLLGGPAGNSPAEDRTRQRVPLPVHPGVHAIKQLCSGIDNKLECYITLDWEGLTGTNIPAY